MKYLIYKITNKINNKIYIGCHKTVDENDNYMGSGKHLKRAQKKYGIENFEKEILEVFNNPEDMFEMESTLVNSEFVKREDTYNLKEGGYGGFDHIDLTTEERQMLAEIYKLKTSETLKKKWENGEYDSLISIYSERFKDMHENGQMTYDNFKGKKHSEETKRKISETQKKKQAGKNNSQYGSMWIHSLTDKVSKKISKDEFSDWEAKGWLKGRKMKF